MGYHHQRRGSTAGIVLTIVGIGLLSKGIFIGGAIVLAIGVSKLGRWTRDPRRRLSAKIRDDAASQGVRIPNDYRLWQGLSAIYSQRERVVPTLQGDFDDVLGCMWAELRSAATIGEWREVLSKVRRGFEDLRGSAGDAVGDSLGRYRRSTQRWREAEREARDQSNFISAF